MTRQIIFKNFYVLPSENSFLHGSFAFFKARFRTLGLATIEIFNSGLKTEC